MKTIQLNHQFMEALHTLDLRRVKSTAVYAEMCRAADANKVDKVVGAMFAHLRTIRDSEPQKWASIMPMIAKGAAAERKHVAG